MSRQLVLGVSGASGAPYAAQALKFLAGQGREAGIETSVVFTKTARLVWSQEVGTDPADYGLPIYSPQDMTAPFASGSAAHFEGMLILPASAGTMGRIANGISSDLVGRAADVMLKERKKLVIVLRESPFSLIHVRNMETLLLAGAVIMPASPSFYSRPDSIEALLDTVISRALDRLDIPNNLMKRWEGVR
jgi:4-hydroxy-3-polyprenylbenzoate decarboxylase